MPDRAKSTEPLIASTATYARLVIGISVAQLVNLECRHFQQSTKKIRHNTLSNKMLASNQL